MGRYFEDFGFDCHDPARWRQKQGDAIKVYGPLGVVAPAGDFAGGGVLIAAWIKGGPVQMHEQAVELSARQVGVNGQVGR
jgi:hypothetical protein